MRRGLALLTCTFLTGVIAPCLSDSAAFAATGYETGNGAEIDMFDAPPAEPIGAQTMPPAEEWEGAFGVPSDTTQDAPVDLEANNVTHDEAAQTVTASGDVEMVQGGRILKADTVSYNLQTDKVRATGNVVLSEADGTTYFADDVELKEDMKDGFVKSLQVLLADGSRFTAEEGERISGTKMILRRASYTPCEPCKEDPSKPPLWQLRADKVTHDEAEKKIIYRDAWFEFAGVPLAYTPYFSHSDGSEKQKSGFLTPTVGFDSELGPSYQQEYYWAVAPDKDVTVGAVVPTNVNPVALAEYRQRFENASFQINGSGTYSDRIDSIAGRRAYIDDEARGHLFGEGQWDMDEKWRSGTRLAVASDDQYLRQYNIDSDDVLENEIYAERFSGRDYLVGRALAFQDVRVSRRQVDQPAVLPEVLASFYGDPNGFLGGRWNANVSALGLYRDGNGQDLGRSTVELGWQRRYITGFGLVNTFDALMRGDAYNVQDRVGVLDDRNKTHTRGFANANWEVSYPFVKRFDESQVTIAPVASVTAGTNVDFDDDIPNEDSQDFVLDPTNLFESNRFAGYDLIEDRSHATYGIRTGWFGDNGYRGEVFFGQSYRFEDEDNPFNVGSGLSEQKSDYVGQITGRFAQWFNLDYRFQLNEEDFSSQRHEVDTTAEFGRLQLGTRYFYAAGIEGTDLDFSREQIRPSARLRLFGDWYTTGAVRYDFGEEDKGLRSASYGLDYDGQCMTFALTAQRTLTDDETGDSDTEILLRIGLKNLGEFESSGISIGGSSDNDNDDE